MVILGFSGGAVVSQLRSGSDNYFASPVSVEPGRYDIYLGYHAGNVTQSLQLGIGGYQATVDTANLPGQHLTVPVLKNARLEQDSELFIRGSTASEKGVKIDYIDVVPSATPYFNAAGHALSPFQQVVRALNLTPVSILSLVAVSLGALGVYFPVMLILCGRTVGTSLLGYELECRNLNKPGILERLAFSREVLQKIADSEGSSAQRLSRLQNCYRWRAIPIAET